MPAEQFTLYTHGAGPNGWKVAFVLTALGLTYKSIYLNFEKAEHKAPEYTKFNPNGRIPAIIDHANRDFVLWESCAIVQYLVDTYDKEHKFSVTGKDAYLQAQWLFFQASGQGPYFGQAAWFIRFHDVEIPSAIERYQNETIRVLGVLESVLSKQEWLVGGKLTVADVSFLSWNIAATWFFTLDWSIVPLDFAKDFPATYAWHQKLLALPFVKKVLAEKEEVTKAK